MKNDKFIYKNGDLKICFSLCELCKFYNNQKINECFKYKQGKPTEILNNLKKCPNFEKKQTVIFESRP